MKKVDGRTQVSLILPIFQVILYCHVTCVSKYKRALHQRLLNGEKSSLRLFFFLFMVHFDFIWVMGWASKLLFYAENIILSNLLDGDGQFAICLANGDAGSQGGKGGHIPRMSSRPLFFTFEHLIACCHPAVLHLEYSISKLHPWL